MYYAKYAVYKNISSDYISKYETLSDENEKEEGKAISSDLLLTMYNPSWVSQSTSHCSGGFASDIYTSGAKIWGLFKSYWDLW